jgi:hypothetical protein
LPSSIDAEEAVIGAVLVHGEAFGEARQLAPSDFFSPRTRAVFTAMRVLTERGAPLDVVSVGEELRTNGDLERLRSGGGRDYLIAVQAKVVTTASIGYHVNVVREHAARRRLIKISGDLAEAIRRGDDPAGVAEIFGERLARSCSQPERQSPVRQADAIPIEKIEWVWARRIAAGMLNILDGDPGLGKSTVTNDLAARLTRGQPMPGEIEASDPAGVILISFEEHPGAVMVPRLMAAGADLSRVFIWDSDARPFNVIDSLVELEATIERYRARLVVIDPLMAALPSSVNCHRDQDIRASLAPLSRLAERTGAAVLFVRHFKKELGGSAVHRGGGSIAIIGACRCGLALARDPEADVENDDGSRILAMSKCNVARLAPSLALRVVPAPSPAPGIEVASVTWGGISKISADQLVKPQEDRTEVEKAVKLLRALLKDAPVLATDIAAAFQANGVSPRTGDRAKDKLGIVSKREGVKGKWWWHLPDQVPEKGHNAK